MNKFNVMVLMSLIAFSGVLSFEDECSQFKNCRTCLDIPAGKETGGRNNCGWCHFNIEYAAGGVGKRCADIRDHPWRCLDEYDTYKCGIGWKCDYTKGQCVMAAEGEGYGNQTTCTEHCFKSAETYKCNTTSYQCMKCQPGHDADCQDKSTACANCIKPHPKPTPTPKPHQHDHFTCDTETLTCRNGTSGGTVKATCASQCSNSTPASLVGVWRGFQAQKGFHVGEWDVKFSTNTATIKSAHATYTYNVANVPGHMVFTCTSSNCLGKVYNVVDLTLNNGEETESHALLMSGPGGVAPTSMEQAMSGENSMVVNVVSRCNVWKSKTCDFSSVFPKVQKLRSKQMGMDTLDAQRSLLSTQTSKSNSDGCNQFLTCSTCIGASIGNIKCGWCMGGNIVYNNTGDSGLHCAGFEAGKPFAFTCSPEFRTQDCRGYACNWTASQPTCQLKEGGHSTKENCERDCKATTKSQCNWTTKKCEPCTGTKCQTTDECNAVCGQKMSKCNFVTKKCESCDPSTDKNCTQTQGACGTACAKQTYGVCDPETGTCKGCDPTTGTPGCVSGCNSTCTKHPQPSSHNYGCDWSNSSQPVCKQGLGKSTKSDCLTNCKAPTYSKCNTQTGKCVDCNPASDKSCQFTKDYCAASCHKMMIPSGEYRGNQINQQFHYGEWDFTFHDNSTVSYGSGSQKYEATVSTPTQKPSEGNGIRFTVTSSTNTDLFNTGDVLTGLYKTSSGQQTVTKFYYLGLSAPNGDIAMNFDDAMQKLEFVLVSCKKDGESNCDFSSTRLN